MFNSMDKRVWRYSRKRGFWYAVKEVVRAKAIRWIGRGGRG